MAIAEQRIKNSSTTTGGRLNATASSTDDEISDYLLGLLSRNLKVAYQGNLAYSEAAALTATRTPAVPGGVRRSLRGDRVE